MMAYMLGNAYIMSFDRGYFFPYNVLPLALFIIYTATFHLQYLVFFLAFCTPLAVTLKEMGLTEGPDLSLPTEPVMFGVMLVYILNYLQKDFSDKRFFNHPVTIIITIQLAWMFITTCTSVEFIISFKYLVSRLWFIFSCYLIIPHLFQNKKNILNFVFAYSIALTIVVIYATIIHAQFNFNDKAADWAASPFYNDHTAYAAALAMFVPVLFSFLFLKSVSKYLKIVCIILFFMFLGAIVLSFTRAAWLSLVVALFIFITLILKIKFKTLVATFLILGGLIFAFQTEILMALGRNNTDAKDGFENNIESVSNISTDASNLERLNRWSCAFRMWRDKPVFGYGPGTYMFKYAPYQKSGDRTSISTNFGTNGNAHSEYFGPLAEQGTLGMLIMLALLLYSTSLGYRLVYSLSEREDRVLCIGLFLGLMTYFIHGFINNFLDTDKLSLPFWAFLAALVCFDIYYPTTDKKRIT